ncbi:trypsin-like peptidase domain-containing protein [Spiractinospora alimapuensis]|uniref:trypsin-like serine peptidase n=1 Tax=Spiractinospora alimapuensis TaxID=2820884 RepID=UPI001F2BDB29|nr:trypsin-like peptidase domain-containing protein [Spiractinospora alimapuensis]QVQ53707.1 trypsin-like peptidase domain-containing protein [Spiractinospora alimapuensis]
MARTLAASLVGTAASAVLFASAGPAIAAPAAPADPEERGTDTPEIVHHEAAATDNERNSVLSYWTDARMSAAEPLARLLEQTGGLTITGDPTQSAGSDAQAAQGVNPNSTGEPWPGGGTVVEATGRVFLTMGGNDYTCSAALVNAENRSTVVTAGHCVADGEGGWADNWVFVPGYDNGDEPYGRFAARDMLATDAWAENGDDEYDYAMVALHDNDAGTAPQDAAAALGIEFNAPVGEQVYTFGYPAAGRFDGNELHYCSGTTVEDPWGTDAYGVPCEMTQGSSGGPFLSDFDTSTGEGTVTSVISFKYSDDDSTQYGPRLGDEARNLYEQAASK